MSAAPIPVAVKRAGTDAYVIEQGPVRKQPYFFTVRMTEGQAREVATGLAALLDAPPVRLDYARHLADRHDATDAVEAAALGADGHEAVHADLHDARDCGHDHDWDYEPLIEEGVTAVAPSPATYRHTGVFFCVAHEGAGDADDLECDCHDATEGPCDFRRCYIEETP